MGIIIKLKHDFQKKSPHGLLAGVVGFEPTHTGVRGLGLTAWRHPINYDIR